MVECGGLLNFRAKNFGTVAEPVMPDGLIWFVRFRSPVGRPCQSGRCQAAQTSTGFTLVEVLVSVAIAALVIGGVMTGYTTKTKRAEWSAYSTAAQSAALQQVEQIRTAKWDPLALPATDELVGSNFPVVPVKLDLPDATGTPAYATNHTTITSLSSNPPLKLIRVDTVWFLNARGPFTNTVTTYRSP
jgi:prepilin-type N-terminal cleavage/methylation domain-containing protein